MAPSSDQDPAPQSLSEFREELDTKIPLTPPRHLSAFHDEPTIKESGRLLRIEVMTAFMVKISHLPVSRSNALLTELNTKIQDVIDEYVAKHKEFKTQCEAEFGRRIVDLCKIIRPMMEEKLVLHHHTEEGDMDMEGVLGIVMQRGMSLFENYNHGNKEAFFQEQKEKLKKKMEEMKKEMLETKGRPQAASGQVSNEPVQLPVNGDEDAAATVTPAPAPEEVGQLPLAAMSMSATENELIEEFRKVFYSSFPLKHLSQFYDAEQIRGAADLQKEGILKKFLEANPNQSADLLKERFQKIIDDFMKKNEDHKLQSVTFLKKQAKLQINSDMDIKSAEDVLERRKMAAIRYFGDNWNLGNVELYEKHENELKETLEHQGKEMLENHHFHLENAKAEKVFENVKGVILEKSRQINCYVRTLEGKVAVEVLKERVQGLYDYLAGVGEALNEKYRKVYLQLVGTKTHAMRFLAEMEASKSLSREDLIEWAHKLDSKLKFYSSVKKRESANIHLQGDEVVSELALGDEVLAIDSHSKRSGSINENLVTSITGHIIQVSYEQSSSRYPSTSTVMKSFESSGNKEHVHFDPARVQQVNVMKKRAIEAELQNENESEQIPIDSGHRHRHRHQEDLLNLDSESENATSSSPSPSKSLKSTTSEDSNFEDELSDADVDVELLDLDFESEDVASSSPSPSKSLKSTTSEDSEDKSSDADVDDVDLDDLDSESEDDASPSPSKRLRRTAFPDSTSEYELSDTDVDLNIFDEMDVGHNHCQGDLESEGETDCDCDSDIPSPSKKLRRTISEISSPEDEASYVGVDFNIPVKGDFPLLRAIRDGESSSHVGKMLGCGADVNIKGTSGDYPGFNAAHQVIYSLVCGKRTSSSALAILHLLESNGFTQINEKCSGDVCKSPLYYAMEVEDLSAAMLSWFYHNGADFNDIAVECGDSYPVLFHAIRQGQSGSILRKLIDYGADVKHVTSKWKRNALHFAAKHGNLSALAPANLLFSRLHVDYEPCLLMLLRRGAHFGEETKASSLPVCSWIENFGNPFPTLIKLKDDLPITDSILSYTLATMLGMAEDRYKWLCVGGAMWLDYTTYFKLLIEDKHAKLRLKNDLEWTLQKNWEEIQKNILTREFFNELSRRMAWEWEGDIIGMEAKHFGKLEFIATASGSSISVPIETVLLCVLASSIGTAFVKVCKVVEKFCVKFEDR